MTEAEWLAATDPQPMLEFLRGKASDRKLRLYAVAWCRRGWDVLTNRESRKAIEVSELFADGLESPRNLHSASEQARQQISSSGPRAMPRSRPAVAYGGLFAAVGVAAADAREATGAARSWWLTTRKRADYDKLQSLEDRARTDLLRCIFGNPFRAIVPVDPAWLAWQGGTVPQLARAAYDERRLPEGTLDPGRLAVLADALEDAGCADAALLGHCRSGGEHVRGCWALDLVLGKG